MTFVFAMLPHAPRLEDLAASTPPLLRWASLVAHVEPNNIDVVPKDVRSIEGVKKLLDILRDTKDKTEQERLDAEKEARQIDRAVESALEEGKAEGRAEGLAEGEALGEARGKAEGKAELMRQLGITTAADYIAKLGTSPPVEIVPLLKA